MPKAFDFSSPPFDRLRPMEVERVKHAVDIAFFRRGQTIIAAGTLPDQFFVVIKGIVEERQGAEVVAVHESGDAFDSAILVHQSSRHDFVVAEEAICYILPIEDFLDLTANNPAFAAFFFNDISHKMEALGLRQANPQALGALTVKVGQALLHPPVYVGPETTLHEAALHMDRAGQRGLLVKDGERVRATFPIALGRGGPGDKQKLGDNKTPVGTYRIVGVNDNTAFDTFLRLNYPNVKDAFYGLKSRLISRREFDRIVAALRHNQVPPQNTRLGGAIGIHGLGEETPEKVHIQNKLDWTQGCIALRNHDLHELREFIEVGTRVVISE